MKTYLRKVKFNKGVMEGRPYDYTRIFIEIEVYEKAEKEFGLDTLELEFGDEADHVKLEQYRGKGKLPVPIDVEWTPVRKGNDIVNLVTKFEVLTNIHEKPKGGNAQ